MTKSWYRFFSQNLQIKKFITFSIKFKSYIYSKKIIKKSAFNFVIDQNGTDGITKPYDNIIVREMHIALNISMPITYDSQTPGRDLHPYVWTKYRFWCTDFWTKFPKKLSSRYEYYRLLCITSWCYYYVSRVINPVYWYCG